MNVKRRAIIILIIITSVLLVITTAIFYSLNLKISLTYYWLDPYLKTLFGGLLSSALVSLVLVYLEYKKEKYETFEKLHIHLFEQHSELYNIKKCIQNIEDNNDYISSSEINRLFSIIQNLHINSMELLLLTRIIKNSGKKYVKEMKLIEKLEDIIISIGKETSTKIYVNFEDGKEIDDELIRKIISYVKECNLECMKRIYDIENSLDNKHKFLDPFSNIVKDLEKSIDETLANR